MQGFIKSDVLNQYVVAQTENRLLIQLDSLVNQGNKICMLGRSEYEDKIFHYFSEYLPLYFGKDSVIFEYINEQGYPQCEIADVILSRQNVNIENYKKSELIPLFPYGYDSYAKYYWQEDGSPPYFYFKWYIFEKI